MKGILLPIVLLMALTGTMCRRMSASQAAAIQEDACLNSSRVKQGIHGQIYFLSGNFMPGPDAKGGNNQPTQRRLYVFPAFKPQGLVPGGFLDSTLAPKPVYRGISCPNGTFGVALQPGTYSIMVMEEGRLYANGMDGMGNINPVEVVAGKVTEFPFNINYKAVY